ncbi:ABC transporter ATP-binding protein [Pseudothauera nasutitermitis]|uniref:ABC transporter ATP-binding protein n=1 Tax=Pseudothauera nasutitermitis TaxID=2565930 RepID=A0A4S4ATU2_9RHOO|nr:ABC transporter ATP-binding protein [Pseudothauera nasutitermitis]THF63160.1 ABC transporter ATP-binding protein [Pseudothauera nasutitermitis]
MKHPAAPLLEASHLALRVGGCRLCGDLDLCLRAGECWVLLGPNGAGKTTLLHTLAGLRAPDAGEVRLDGRPYAAWRGQQAARFRGLLAQQQPDQFASTVLETVLVGRHPHLGRWGWEGPEDERIARAALDSVGLGELAARDILSLSGGERQRVALAALLAQSPRVLLLDEPTNHLDLRYQIAVLDLIRARADSGHGVVMVLHDINLAARYADRIVLLDGRGGAQAGTRDEVLRADLLGAAFGHPLVRHEIDGRAAFLPA